MDKNMNNWGEREGYGSSVIQEGLLIREIT